MSQQRFDLIRRVNEARDRGDVDAMLEAMADDVVVDASRRVLDPFVAEGHEGFRRFIAVLDEAWANQRLEPEEMIEAGNDVVVAVRLISTGLRSGMVVTARAAWVVTFRGDKIARVCVYQTRAESLEAVGLRDQTDSRRRAS
jgi:ketosteroid isomerase-like protein